MLAPASTAVPQPLHERTNSHAEPMSLGNALLQSPPTPKAVRRTDSLRRIRFKVDSDSLPEEDSIYNADPVSSGETTPALGKLDWQLPSALISPPTSAEPVEHAEEEPEPHLSPPPRSRSPPLGHSNWPVPMLDTILERKSARSLRGSLSAPRLGASPQRSPKVVKTKDSIRSIHPTVTSSKSPWPRDMALPATGLHHERSFSMNDLHCSESICKRISETCTLASSRSSEALRGIPTRPTSPLQPAVPPPYRYPTPPGLPSFRTREAQELRLQERQDSRGLRSVQRWFRHEEDLNNDRPFSQHGSESPASPPEDQVANPSLEMLKRMFGIARLVQAPNQSPNDRPRASLPPGLYATGVPGVLAVASDGTQIRGKFGNRQSSHGIGSRSLQSHPFGIPQGQAAIEEAVRQIDKACAETSNGPDRNHLLQLPQFPSIAEEMNRHSTLSEMDRSLRYGEHRTSTQRSAAPSARSPPIPPANTGVNSPLRSPIRSQHLSAGTMDSTSAMGMDPVGRSPASSYRYRMSEPRAYPPLLLPQSGSVRNGRGRMVGLGGFAEDDEQGSSGRRADEATPGSQREKSEDDPSCCARCWHGCCLSCCY